MSVVPADSLGGTDVFAGEIYTNGVSDITHFGMWREIARVEPIGENAYKIVQRSGVKYKLYLHEGDRLPVNLTTPDDIGTEAFKH